jgi:signal transduction histidine kinase/ActR/RegA family two-component response regulator
MDGRDSSKARVRRRAIPILILTVLAALAALSYWSLRPGLNHRRTYRIGYGEDRPYHFTGNDGQPTGLAVDIVQEAARRRGIHLDWMKAPGAQGMAALQGGEADLWVLLTIRPERLHQVYFSEPYLIADTCFLVPQNSPIKSVEDLKRARISLLDFDVHQRNVADILPDARQVPVESVMDVLAAVNDGRADAAYLDRYTGTAALLSGSGRQPLRLLVSTVPRAFLAVGATFASAGIADEIRDEMKDMARDGTLARVIQRWEFFTFTDAVTYQASRERLNQVMMVALAGLVALVVLIALLAYRLRRERNAVREHLAHKMVAEQERQDMARLAQQAQRLESIGRLAGGVAHDFNNLLTVINGYTDLILKRMEPEEQWRGALESIRAAGNRAADLTRQLLAFSRKQVMQPKVVLLNDVVREAENILGGLIGEEIEVRCVLDPALWPVEADPEQIQQAIVNLALNGRDAMPSGGQLTIQTANAKPEELCASCRDGAGHGRFVVLAVTDTGVGMDTATVEQAFEPFFAGKGRGKGAGLGLATVYGIVKQSGGHIGVTSELGCGAKFTIHLPAVERLAEEGPEIKELALGGTETLLLVEDEAEVRQMIGTILSAQGYRALQTGDGKEALRVYAEERGRIDLLISDVLLPGMAGTEVAELLRKQNAELRVLFISGYSDLTITGTSLFKAGAHYLQKPFGPEDLLRKVRQVPGPRRGG